MNHTPIRNVLVGAAIAAGMIVGTTTPADAAPKQAFTVVGSGGTSTADGDGAVDVDVWRATTNKPVPATATFHVRPDDGTFPGAEACEPATATVELHGTSTTTMTLNAVGRVCGAFTDDPTAQPTETFTGRYLVVNGPRRHAGDDGFLQIIVGDTGWSYLLATDT